MFPFVDSFVYPTMDDDAHPFRRIAYFTSHDVGQTFSPATALFGDGHTDPAIAAGANGSFFAAGISTTLPQLHADLTRSDDGGDTFQPIAAVGIEDKAWLAVDDERQAVWIAGASAFAHV